MSGPNPPPSRLVITDVTPVVASGRYLVKRVVGEPVTVGATVFADSHDRLRVVVRHRPAGGKWSEVPMAAVNPGLDRWEATFVVDQPGPHQFRVRAWIDEAATWRDGLDRKVRAGADEPIDHQDRPDAAYPAAGATTSPSVEVQVDAESALFSTWYELFPRSAGRPGTLADVTAQLDELAELGIDVVYLPPIHPIGSSFRKGPNNVEGAAPGDPGSPWAIGSAEGGHAAIHPELGTLEDFKSLVAEAADRDMAVAIDLAFQCSPDHPWVTEHPEWFRHRADGSIQYAENPPKRYQDIYPFDFASADWRALWDALLEVTLQWCERGVRIFRVDNPHTKPFPFWEWLIAEVRTRHPGTVFLAEAFTRPAVMHHLAQLGFDQSYTYFAWRTSGAELRDYFTELSTAPSVDEMRPNVWPNTPDILSFQLQHAPLEAFAVRLVLAATLSPSYGVYGPAFELGDHHPARPGPSGEAREEYLDSEKYQLREWRTAAGRLPEPNLRPLMTAVNRIRRDQLALHTLRTLHFHGADNDALLCYSKTPHAGPFVDPLVPGAASVLVVVNLDPYGVQSGTVWLDLDALGVDGGRPYQVDDLLGGQTFTWTGPDNWIELDPSSHPAHVFRVSQSDVPLGRD
jgi:starch synthase (maltosyl-transferring)